MGGRVEAIHHVNLVVGPGEVDSTAGFWRDVFGLADISRSGRSGRPGAWLAAGSFELHLSERDGRSHPDAHVCVIVDDLDAVRAAVSAAGGSWEVAELLDGFSGRGFTRDPAGNRVEVLARA